MSRQAREPSHQREPAHMGGSRIAEIGALRQPQGHPHDLDMSPIARSTHLRHRSLPKKRTSDLDKAHPEY